MTAHDGAPGEPWDRYARALLQVMQEVLGEAPADVHPLLLENADYWLSLGLALGAERPAEARRLLAVIEADDGERSALAQDAAQFVADVLQ